MIWEPNKYSETFSRCYDDTWVEKLCRGFRRNLTAPFQFSLFTDRPRQFTEDIVQYPVLAQEPQYGCFTEPYRLNEPMILVGLDTVIVGNIDHMVRYCLSADKIALPRNPYNLEQSINGVALVPAGQRRIFDDWRGENDMEWLRKQDTAFIDDLWPGEVLSLKAHDVRRKGLQGAKIVYMHGVPKMHQLGHLDWIREHWV